MGVQISQVQIENVLICAQSRALCLCSTGMFRNLNVNGQGGKMIISGGYIRK